MQTQTIALIDDDRNILTSLSSALEKEGFKVQTYIDGESALIGLTRMPPDLAVIDITKEFITNEGKFNFKDIKSIPSIVKSSTDQTFKIYRPTFKEFILLMKRGPQIIYPKDISQIVIEANISSSSKVLEIGTGSGALTLYLLNILN